MEISNSEQHLAHTKHGVETELKVMRESVRQGTAHADSEQVVPATTVFGELRQRNEAAPKRIG